MTPLRWFSRAILPLTYSDSLSYYEVLARITNKINEIIQYITTNLGEFIQEAVSNSFLAVMYDEETETLTLELKEEE